MAIGLKEPPAFRAWFERAHPIVLAVLLAVGAGMMRPAAVGFSAQEAAEALPQATVPARSGEICIVCNGPVASHDRVYLVDGQRVPVHVGECEAALHKTPDRYLAGLKPRGAFLGAEPSPGPNLSKGWLLLGVYVLAGLIFGGLCGYRAVNRGLRPLPWFLAGFLANVLAYVVLLTRPAAEAAGTPGGLPSGLVKIPVTRSPRPCPACGTRNHPSANICSGCGRALEPLVASEVSRAGL